MKRCHRFLLLTLLLLAAPPVLAQDDPLVETLERELPGLLEQGNIPGLSIAVTLDGAVRWSGAFGVKSLETNEPVDAQTIFEAASLSKPVFAYAVFRLVERGGFDLDTPLAEYLPYERLIDEPRYRLIPMAQDLFALDGLETFRMRFVEGDTGRVVKIVGLYVNGNQDETPRDS